MERKTFEYLKAKTEQFEHLIKEIEAGKELIAIAKGKGLQCIRLAVGSNSLELTKWGAKQVPNCATTEAEARMANALIDVMNAEIKHLEQELAEL